MGDDDLESCAQQFLRDLEKVIGDYERVIEASRGYLHVPRARDILNKSYEKLKKYFNKFIKPWLQGKASRPAKLDFYVQDVFPTSFFNQELPALLANTRVGSDA